MAFHSILQFSFEFLVTIASRLVLFLKAPLFALDKLHREEALNFKPESLDGVPDEDSLEEAEVLFVLNEMGITS